jgi:hypothetical protein
MCLIIKNQKGITTLLILFISVSGHCQETSNLEKILNAQTMTNKKEIGLKRSNFSFEIAVAVQPKANISRTEGNYTLQSSHKPSYDGGLNYVHNINKDWLVSSGFHVVLGERNYFAHVPDEDVRSFFPTGRFIIFNKALWGAVRVPLLVERKINTTKAGLASLKAGLNVRYSGFVHDLEMGGAILDSNNNVTRIFSASFSGNNDDKPWITFLAGASKLFVLDNKNILSIGLQADISTTYFFMGNYSITIPNKPVTSGTYKINGTSLGLAVQYIFTGTNKRLIRSYQRKYS